MKTKRMISTFIALIMMIGLLPIMASAETVSGSCGSKATWAYDTATQTLTISGTGSMNDYKYNLPWKEYEDSITSVVVNSGITYLGDYVFKDFDNLVSATLPESVTSVGTDIFKFCKKLKAITLPTKLQAIGDYMFYGCHELNNVTIPESVTQIGNYAFTDCKAFTTITIPKNVRTIGKYALRGCESLTFITVDKDNAYFENDSNGILYDKGKNSLIAYPLASPLESYQIPYGVKTVCDDSFYSSVNLKSVIIPETVTAVGSYAFAYGKSLETVVIKGKIDTLGSLAFCECANLKTVALPDTLKIIKNSAFVNCSNLQTVHFLGPEETFSDLNIDGANSSTGNRCFTNAVKHYCTQKESKEATCSEQGFILWSCATCTDFLEQTITENPDNHLDAQPKDHICDGCSKVLSECVLSDNGLCDYCGKGQSATLNDDGFYEITNAGNLFWFAQQVNEVGNREIKAILTNDIDLENRPWIPIGTTGENNNNFRGVFDGQGHTIRGLNVTGTKSGVGFFGEARTGTIKNFTIYGEVTIPKNYTYVGGVVGSACGVNVENNLERNGAIIQNVISYVNLTTTAHGVGRVGGFMGYANHETLVENCAWYGTFNLGEYRAEAGVGGFIGRVQENSNSELRNCGAYGTIKTNYKKGAYNNCNDIFIGGFTGWSVQGDEARPTNTVIENCLFAGKFELGSNITDMIDYSAFGCLAQIKSVKNCYYLDENGLRGVNNNSTYKPLETELVSVDESQLASGEIAYKLGLAWGQKVGTDNYPVFYNGNNYLIPKLTVTNSSVKIETLFEDAVLIVASYKGEKMVDTKIIPVSGACTKSISSTGLNVSNYDEIKAFLWKSLTTLKPMCEEDVYDNTGEFDGEWVSIF